MNRLFGTSKAKPNPAPQPAQPVQEQKTYDLSEVAKRSETKQQELTHIINEIDKEITENYAKTKKLKGVMATTAKQRCVMLLKKKKMYEQQLITLMNNQFALDQMAFTKENIQQTMEMGQAMQQAVQVQRQMFKEVDMDKMEDLMDDMEDMKEESEYMNEMMNRNYNVDIDEDELEREMQEIDNDIYLNGLNKQQNQVPGQVNVQQQQQYGAQVQSQY